MHCKSSSVALISQKFPHQDPRKSRWTTLKHVLRASCSFRLVEAKKITDLDNFSEEFRHISTDKKRKSVSLLSETIDQYREQQKLLFYINRSRQDDLIKIRTLINNSSFRYVRNLSDSNSLINKADTNGIRPLYQACRNGYRDTVQLLIDLGADPKLLSNGETCLSVSTRWGYLEIVRLLMHSSWTGKEIKSAMKETRNPVILQYLKGALPRSSSWFICRTR